MQHIKRIVADCDRDALAVYVEKEGPACHLGTDSCFNDELFICEGYEEKFTLESLMELIKGQKDGEKKRVPTRLIF